MITNLIINVVLVVFGSFFSFFDIVQTLPTINGFDIDGALVSGMSAFYTFIHTFWYIGDVFYGFLFLMGYFLIKAIYITFFGSHALKN